jgi:signal transduction histidine kinase
MKLLRSLRVRLLLMFMFVVIVTLATVAFIQVQATTSAFRDYTNSAKQIYPVRKDLAPIIGNILASYQSGNLQGLKAQMAEVAIENEVRVILVASNNRIVFDSNEFIPQTAKNASNAPYRSGTSITQLTPALFSTSSLPVILISTNAASPLLSSPPPPSSTTSTTLKQDFLNTITHSFWLVIVLAWLLALLLTLALSNHILKPVRELTRTANRMERGDLSQRVSIRTKDEMGVLAHAFNTMADGLERSEQLRRNLMSDVTHELRTPLTNIQGYLEALHDRVVEPTPGMINSIYEESLLLNRLVADLQELSLAEAGQLCLVRRPISLEEITVKAVQALHMQAASKQLSIQVHLPRDLPLIEADPERLGQILRNLLSNAITHTPAGGEINVRAYATGSEVRVSVQDTGEGIPAQHLPYVFERFYRADSSRARATGGTGLGLAIVKQMVQAHGGWIEAESQLGQGACFTFTLPVVATGQPAGI